MSTPSRPVLVYDGDCAFCTATATAWQPRLAHGTADDPEVLPSHRVDLAAYGIEPRRAREELLWIARDGSVLGGAEAVAAWLCWQPGPWRPVGVLLRQPAVRPLAARAYRVVARNRHRLPGGTAACEMR